MVGNSNRGSTNWKACCKTSRTSYTNSLATYQDSMLDRDRSSRVLRHSRSMPPRRKLRCSCKRQTCIRPQLPSAKEPMKFRCNWLEI